MEILTIWIILPIAILGMVLLTLIFLATTKKAYNHKHTVDPIPKQSTSEKENT